MQVAKKMNNTRKLRRVEAAKLDAKNRALNTGDWTDAKASTFVGLYVLCHEMIYGFVPFELKKNATFLKACKYAKDIWHQHFKDDNQLMVKFIKWSWEREKSLKEYGEKQNYTKPPLNFYKQFDGKMITEFLVDQSRKRV